MSLSITFITLNKLDGIVHTINDPALNLDRIVVTDVVILEFSKAAFETTVNHRSHVVVVTGPPMMQDIGRRDLRIAFVD